MKKILISLIVSICLASPAIAKSKCKKLPTYKQLQKALETVVKSGNGGLFKPNMMWATIVTRGGLVCAVAKTGDAWPGSRIISVQKASTANAFSNNKLSLSTANLFSAVQPGGSLFGLQHSNPVDPEVAYKGRVKNFGTKKDPLVGRTIGGVNVFGGGLALYAKDGKTVLGAIGVSGDSSCADHNIAWRLRKAFGFDKLPGGVSAAKTDNIIYDIAENGKSKGGFGHPACGAAATKIAKSFDKK